MGLLSRLFGSGAAVDELDVAEVSAVMTDSGIQIVDCRTEREWKSGHIDGARLMPLGSIGDHLHELETGHTVIVVCRSGHRSGIAARQLTRAGFTDVKSLKGGINAWNRAGKKLVS